MLPDLPPVKCEVQNPCVIGSCAADTNPCDGSYQIETQAELDAIRGCTSVSGQLTIHAPDVENLGQLALMAVGGDLNINGVNLTTGYEILQNLKGLDRLASVGRDLVIESTLSPDLHGLEGLRYVGRNLVVKFHEVATAGVPGSLRSLDGLKLTGMQGSLSVFQNDSLTDITALSSLTCLGALYINDDLSLRSLHGVENIERLGSLYVSGVADLSALQHLTTLPGDLYLSSASDVTDFGKLTAIGGTLSLTATSDLTSLAGFASLKSIGKDLLLEKGPNLKRAGGPGRLEVVGGNVVISQSSLADFKGMDSLVAIGGDLDLSKFGSLSATFVGLEHLRSIGGSATIGKNFSLAGLEGLVYVGQTFDLEGDQDFSQLAELRQVKTLALHDSTTLEDVGDLARVTVTDSITIAKNAALKSLGGLSPASALAKDILVTDNPSLTSLQGLEGVVSIGGSLSVRGNALLGSLRGLDSLASVSGDVSLADNPALASLDGLDALTAITGSLSIAKSALTDLHGLKGLETIGGDFRVESSVDLVSVEGPKLLTSIGGVLRFDGLTSLTNLRGLNSLSHVGGLTLLINNTSLPECEVKRFFAQLATTQGYSSGNGNGVCP